MAKITKRTVDALRPESRERVVWDDDIKGFGLRVHPSGKKVYIVKYRHRGRAVKTTIGPHGPVTPADARTRAAEIITAARTGRDPESTWPLRCEVSDDGRVGEAISGGVCPSTLQAGHAGGLPECPGDPRRPEDREASRGRNRTRRHDGTAP